MTQHTEHGDSAPAKESRNGKKWTRWLPLAIGAVALVVVLAKQSPRGSGAQSCCGALSAVTTSDAGAAKAVSAPSTLPRLLDLGATKCIPCKMMAPILEEMKETYAGTLDVDFIDVWQAPEEGKTYGVKAIPTQIFFDASGQELFRHEGFFSKEEILKKWRELGVAIEEGE